MIEKILNKYFTKKAVNFVKNKLIMIRMDKKVINTKNSYVILIKNIKEKDEYYKPYMEIFFDEGFEKLIYFLTNNDLNYLERASNILER